MTRADEFRRRADLCQAKIAPNNKVSAADQASWIEIQAEWLRMAEEADLSPWAFRK